VAGDPSNASIWVDADVYTGATDAVDPATVDDAFGIDWDLVGLLDGEAGFVKGREEEVEDHYAWGGILVRTSRRNFKQTVTFTALEDNAVTRDLVWPDSEPGELVVPRPKRIKIAFETREGDKVHRLISAYQAEVTVNGDITDSESDLTRYELLATIFPLVETGEPSVLFVEQASVVVSS
jgi:hypothetical protein